MHSEYSTLQGDFELYNNDIRRPSCYLAPPMLPSRHLGIPEKVLAFCAVKEEGHVGCYPLGLVLEEHRPDFVSSDMWRA